MSKRRRDMRLSLATVQKVERREAKIARLMSRLKDNEHRRILIAAINREIGCLIQTDIELWEERDRKRVAKSLAKMSRKKLWDRRTKGYKAMVAARSRGETDLQALANATPALEQTNADDIEALRASIRADAVAAGVDDGMLAPSSPPA